MSAITTQCTTCGVRMKVRDPKLVGEIVTCPKCGSMVLVAPLSGPSSGGKSLKAATSTASVDSSHDFDMIGDVLGEGPRTEPPLPAEESSSAVVDPPRATDPEPDALSPTETVNPPLESEPPVAATAAAEPQVETVGSTTAATRMPAANPASSAPTALPAVRWEASKPSPSEPSPEPTQPRPAAEEAVARPNPAEAWSSPQAARWRTWAALGAAGLAGVVLAVLICLAWISGMAGPTVAEASPDAPPPGNGDSAESIPAETPARSQDPEPAADDSGDPASAEIAAPSDPSPAPKQPTEPQPPAADPANPVKDPAGTSRKVEARKPPLDPLADDPLGIGALTAPIDPLVAAGAEPTPEPDEEIDWTGGRPPLRRIDVAAQLSLPLEQIEIPPIPLTEFTAFASDLTAAPITIDPWGFYLAGAAADAKVQVRGQQLTAGKLIDDAVRPLGLGLRIEESGAVLTHRLLAANAIRAQNYTISDLTQGDSAQGQALGDLVQQMVAPDQWSGQTVRLQATADQLVVTQTMDVHFQLLLFVERLRVARGLAPQSTLGIQLHKTGRLNPSPPAVDRLLAQRVSVKFIRPAPLKEVLAALARQSGAAIIVDWRALGEMHWSHRLESSLIEENAPLEQALRNLLEPRQLTWRAVNDRTLQITSPPAKSRAAVEPVVRFHALPTALAATDAEEVRSQATSAAALSGESSGSERLDFSPDGRLIVLRAAPAQHARLRQWLKRR